MERQSLKYQRLGNSGMELGKSKGERAGGNGTHIGTSRLERSISFVGAATFKVHGEPGQGRNRRWLVTYFETETNT